MSTDEEQDLIGKQVWAAGARNLWYRGILEEVSNIFAPYGVRLLETNKLTFFMRIQLDDMTLENDVYTATSSEQ